MNALAAGLANKHGTTALSTFGRRLRDEPHKGLYPHKIWIKNGKIDPQIVKDWLGERYVDTVKARRKGALYEVRSYKHQDGNRYVDFIYFQKLTDAEMMHMTMLWGVSDKKLTRDGRARRPKLTQEERKHLDQMIDAYYREVYDTRQRMKPVEGGMFA